ncbi:MAG: UDP-N-acetylmuramoyl-L-alanyl-D-glutamate--2,6-diaminopimelate ligase [Gammaproteobacteria bacterium]|nr:UDP-N-acetylmuramoyl-L-alanyl-D-glutamate--2,6-diaminopimelate ligase [Gammaproteobacteria bacterium]NNM21823.1 UDP-N-acetylmuramoyl-L-alanyl-D-glutamate--2,6-diaminopimelate ligase [Gammaproteobacteria bacterium]
MAAARTLHLTLAELLGAEAPPGVSELTVTGLSMSSHGVQPGFAFLACPGRGRHGLDFAPAAAAAGAAVILYEPRGSDAELLPVRVPCIPVPRLSQRAGEIAGIFYARPSARMRVAGLTGTNGKTTVSHLVARAAENTGHVAGICGTLGYGRPADLMPSELTTPDAVTVQQRLSLLADNGVTHVAMEVSSHALDQYRVNGVNFDTAVFTNLSRDHLDYHGDMQAYFEAKRQLFAWPGLRHAVINVNDVAGAQLARDMADTLRVTAVGSGKAILGFDSLQISKVETTGTGLRLVITAAGGDVAIDSPLLGDFNAFNLALALGVLVGWGLEADAAAAALARVRPVAGRMESFGGGDRPLVVVDYAHTPDALDNALRALRRHCARDLWVMFGCGGDRDRGKRSMMGEIAARLADRVVITDDNPRREDPHRIIAEIEDGAAGEHVNVVRGRREAIEWTVAQASAGDIVLLAGKGHEDYQLVGEQRLSLSDRDEARRLVGDPV